MYREKSCLTVFQSYQADGRVIMKGCVHVQLLKMPPTGLKSGTGNSVGQRLTH